MGAVGRKQGCGRTREEKRRRGCRREEKPQQVVAGEGVCGGVCRQGDVCGRLRARGSVREVVCALLW